MPDDRTAPEHGVDTIEDDRPSFRAVRKGYDPEEVDSYVWDLLRERDALVDELAAAAVRDDAQRADLGSVRAELQAYIDHEAALAAAPSSEGDRVMDSARAAAVEIRTRAQIEANDLIKAANDEVRAIRADAEQLVMRRTREAEEVAATRLREAGEGVRHAHDQAEALLRQTEERADASLEAARTRARSLVGEAESARAEAVAEAAVIVHEAERRGHELIEEARSVRERIVGDLTRRRAKLRGQVEQLQAGRDRLLDAFQVVRDALDEATVELEVVLPEARDAAQDAAQRAATEPDPVLDEALARLRADAPHDRAELAYVTGEHTVVDDDEAPVDEVIDDAPIDDAPPEGEPIEFDDADPDAAVDVADGYDEAEVDGYDEVEVLDEAFDDGTTVDQGEVIEADPTAAAVANPDTPSSVLLGFDEGYGEPPPRRAAFAPDPVEGRWSSAVRIIARPGPADGSGADETRTENAEVAGSTAGDTTAGDTPESGQTTADGTEPPVPGAGAEGTSDPDDAAPLAEPVVAEDDGPLASEAEPPPQPGSPPATEPKSPASFRAGTGSSGAEREQRLPASLVGLVAPSPSESEADVSDQTEALEPVAALEARRDAALAGPRRQLRRRLKATLVEEENELLHAIRSLDVGVPKAHEVLPTEDVHRERLAAAAQPGLLAAMVAGQELGVQVAAEETRRRVPGALPDQLMRPPRVDVDTVDHLAADLASQLATELRARLAACFPVGPPTTDDPRRTCTARDDLMIAVRSAYRGTKAGFVDRVSDKAIVEALNRAVRAQIPSGVHPSGVDVRALFPVSGTGPSSG